MNLTSFINDLLGFWSEWLRPSAGLPTVLWSLLLAAAAASGPLKVSVTRTLMTSSDFCPSSSMPVTSAAKSALDHSNHCAGGASCAKRQASAAVAKTTSMAGTSRRNLSAAIVRVPRRGCRVMRHVHPIKA